MPKRFNIRHLSVVTFIFLAVKHPDRALTVSQSDRE